MSKFVIKKVIPMLSAAAIMTSGSTGMISSAYDGQPDSAHLIALSASAPKQVKVKSSYSASTNALKIYWNRVKGAKGYRIYRYDTAKKKWVKQKTVGSGTLSFRQAGLKPATRYKYKVKAYTKSKGKTIWGRSSATKNTVTKPQTIKFKTGSKTANSITLNWKPVKCSGYQIFQERSGSYVKIASIRKGSAGSYKVTGLRSMTKYNFKVRAYTNDGTQNKFGTFTKISCTTSDARSELDKALDAIVAGKPTQRQINLARNYFVNYVKNKFDVPWRYDPNLTAFVDNNGNPTNDGWWLWEGGDYNDVTFSWTCMYTDYDTGADFKEDLCWNIDEQFKITKEGYEEVAKSSNCDVNSLWENLSWNVVCMYPNKEDRGLTDWTLVLKLN